MIEKAILTKATIAVASVAVVAGAVVAVNHLSETKDTYRSILIYEIEGNAEIEREGTGKFSGAENLYLESGDQLTVEPESFTRLRLDEDKYVMVEEDSALSIEAAGTKEDSRTKINLTKGAIINEIQNPLSANSTYEVTTPNSIMAVRGTIFRVEIYYDENGEVFTKVSVFDGKVSSRLIYPDGTMEEEVITGDGKEVIIHSNQELTEYLGEIRDIQYDELPLDSLYVIQDMMNNGKVIEGITREELAELILRIEDGHNLPGESETDETVEPETAEETESTETEESTKEEPETEEENTRRESQAAQTEGNSLPETSPAEESSAVPESIEETTIAPTETEAPSSSQVKKGTSHRYDSSDDSGDSGGSWGGGSGSGGGSSSGGSQTAESTTEEPTETSVEEPTETVYTVTFMNGSSVFGTQQVTSGQTAEVPYLKPSLSGNWDESIRNPVTKDTTISWNPQNP